MTAADWVALGMIAWGVGSVPAGLVMGQFIHVGKGGSDDQ